MYPDLNMQESIKKVEAARAENVKLDPRRMTAEEKETLLATYHPDYKQEQFTVLQMGPNKSQKVPLELAALLQANSRIAGKTIDLSAPDYDVDVLVIGGGGAGTSAAIEKGFNHPGRFIRQCFYISQTFYPVMSCLVFHSRIVAAEMQAVFKKIGAPEQCHSVVIDIG